MQGYRSPESMPVEINRQGLRRIGLRSTGGARNLERVRRPGLDPLDLHCLARTDSLLVAEVLQSQWRTHLGVRIKDSAAEDTCVFRRDIGPAIGREWQTIPISRIIRIPMTF